MTDEDVPSVDTNELEFSYDLFETIAATQKLKFDDFKAIYEKIKNALDKPCPTATIPSLRHIK